VGHPTGTNGVAQRLRDVFLSDNVAKRLRPKSASQDGVMRPGTHVEDFPLTRQLDVADCDDFDRIDPLISPTPSPKASKMSSSVPDNFTRAKDYRVAGSE